MVMCEVVQFLKGFTPNVSHVDCGKTIKDTYSLQRSPYLSANLACNTSVVFIYWLGKLNIRYN